MDPIHFLCMSPIAMILEAVKVAGPRMHLSNAYAEVVAPTMGFNWRDLVRMSDTDKDAIIYLRRHKLPRFGVFKYGQFRPSKFMRWRRFMKPPDG